MPIFDQGYQHWKGELAGHGWRWLAITRQGIRAGMKNVFLRLLLIGALGPAFMLAGGISLWGLVEQQIPWAINFLRAIQTFREICDDPISFRVTAWTLLFHFFLMVEMWYIMILVMLVGPSLISQDLRFNALPLYFSRPLRRIDYFIGKLGVIAFYLGVVTVAPALLAWILGLCFSLDFKAIIDTFRLIAGMVLFGIIVSLSAGLFILALSSLSRNSRFVAAFWGGMWFLTGNVAGVMEVIHQESVRRNSDQFMFAMNDREMAVQNELRQQPQQAEKLLKELDDLREQIKQHEMELEDQQRNDWRPIISYTANLQRLGFALIGSRAAWEKIDELTPGGNNMMPQHHRGPFRQMPRRFSTANLMAPQFPWYWSALVLLALAGVSYWILNKRVSSLDKLR